MYFVGITPSHNMGDQREGGEKNRRVADKFNPLLAQIIPVNTLRRSLPYTSTLKVTEYKGRVLMGV